MCGIVGAFVRSGSVVPGLIQGLRTLEYRGYDSAGIGAWLDGRVQVRKRQGRLSALEELLGEEPLAETQLAIGHTRWATHGEPSDRNAHPHVDAEGRLALVHNGVIENYLELKAELEAAGIELQSDTDTEVLAHVLGRELAEVGDPLEALRRVLGRVDGYYALGVIVIGDQPRLLAARQGPPLCLGLSDNGAHLGSDLLALLPHTRDIVFLEDGDLAELTPDGVQIQDLQGRPVEREPKRIEWDAEAADKGGFPHYMLKEIHEQPEVLARTLDGRLRMAEGDVELGGEGWDDAALQKIERVQVVACGTALHAGQIASYMIEGLSGIPVDLDFASEFRYRNPRLAPNTMALAISQSGETADTLAALRLATEMGARPAAICNVIGSTLVRESSATILTEAGPEIGVASTKAFVAQLVAAFLLAVRLGRAKGTLDADQGRELLDELRRLRAKLESMLTPDVTEAIRELADRHRNVKGFLFLGRGINFPVALEGALKLKEISYMHAEGYPAGEMKHGPIALVEPDLTTVVVNSEGGVSDKSRANIEQVKARGGRVIAVGSDALSHEIAEEFVPVPRCVEWLSPILNVIPLQLLSYHVADLRGCDIDKPRNLAKSVTVE